MVGAVPNNVDRFAKPQARQLGNLFARSAHGTEPLPCRQTGLARVVQETRPVRAREGKCQPAQKPSHDMGQPQRGEGKEFKQARHQSDKMRGVAELWNYLQGDTTSGAQALDCALTLFTRIVANLLKRSLTAPKA